MPADIEVHRGTDGRYYMLDFARLWPPEVPTQGLQASFLIRKMRPELVRSSPKPLCSDAFSRFQTGEISERDENNREIVEVFIHLMKDVIPSFAKKLETEITDPSLIRKFQLNAEMHEQGISILLSFSVFLIPFKKPSID